ncbi:MAG: hypothetical protein CMJ95_05425 [Planctomycetes bacterium]|nr:hypothetical protein [Planctomycetota bacterium]
MRQGCIIEQRIDGDGEWLCIRWRYQQSGDSIFDHLGDAADRAGDHRQFALKRIEDAGAQSFGETRLEIQIERGQPGTDLFWLLESGQMDPITDAVLVSELLQ